jgi:hypothetical protein
MKKIRVVVMPGLVTIDELQLPIIASYLPYFLKLPRQQCLWPAWYSNVAHTHNKGFII